ncbi:MAG TPA: hypothetical protein VMZ28_17045 [Kofleriaceae bacterium]|nr:hypothetical protein [Kofleriaceae bacterium]
MRSMLLASWLAFVAGCTGSAAEPDGRPVGDESQDTGAPPPDRDAAAAGADAAAEEPDYPTPTPVLRFDGAGFSCPDSGVCLPAMDQCLCQAELDALNYTAQSHFLAVSTEAHRADIRSVGNYQAYYVNDFNHDAAGHGWTMVTAAARADEMVERCEAAFPTICPKWFLINEISSSAWQNNQAYRTWVAGVARRLRVTHDKQPIVFAPFAAPGANGDDWQALAAHAYIGVENYLSGAEIKAHAFSQTWCRGQYQASIDAYGARGVPKSRLVLTEHFGNTRADKPWGRGGVSDADWARAIRVRAAAAGALDFAGFASYAWAFNWVHEEIARRLEYEALYGTLALP